MSLLSRSVFFKNKTLYEENLFLIFSRKFPLSICFEVSSYKKDKYFNSEKNVGAQKQTQDTQNKLGI